MSQIMSSFVLSIQRKFNDYSQYMSDMIYDFTNDRIRDFESNYLSPNLMYSASFTTTANSRDKFLSSYTGIDLRTDGIKKIVNDTNGQVLQRMALNRYLESGQSVSDNKAQFATHWIPYNQEQIILNPIPLTGSTYTFYATKKHHYMSSAPMFFHFADNEVDVIKDGVVADLYADRDDTRYQLWEKKFQDGLKDCKRLQRLAEGQNLRFLPGNSIE